MIILEGKKMTSRDELHKEIREKLALPHYYGSNLDALWDCLTAWVDLPIALLWRDFDDVEKNLGGYAEKVLEVFQEAESVEISILRSSGEQ